MTRIIFFLFVCLVSFVTYAQKPNPKIDSLERALKTAKDTNKVNTYMELARVLVTSEPDKSFQMAKQAHELSLKLNYNKGKAEAFTALGAIWQRKSKADSAQKYLNEALDIFQRTNNSKGQGNVLNNLGSLYMSKNNYPVALEYLQKSLHIREDIRDEKGILTCLNNLGAVYTLQANENPHSKELYAKSREYYEKGLPIAIKLKNKASEASLLNNIGGTYDHQQQYEEALKYYQMALDIYEKTNNKACQITSYSSIGSVYNNLNDIAKAQTFMLKSLKVAEELKNAVGIAGAKFGLAKIYLKQKDYAKAQQTILPAIAIYREAQAKNDLAKSKKVLAQIYEATGKFKEAHEAFKEATALKDSIFNIANTKQMAGLQESFEIAQKEKEIQILQKDKEVTQARNMLFLYGSTGIIIFICGIAVLLYLGQQRQKRYNKEIAKEKAKSDNLLLNILPEPVAEELKEKGEATAQFYKKVSVLFTDFQGFTKRTATMTPQEVIAELNFCFSKFDAIIERHNLEKIKTIGDAYMCAGGLPIPNETNAIDAVRAGLAMQDFMQEYRLQCEAKGEPYFQCRWVLTQVN